ncbi:MAG TPA: MG2 domain-containing protein [Planctomicrobium sp.]|nr:MG2 domain-containing protein [Planctomicrobium sp.]
MSRSPRLNVAVLALAVSVVLSGVWLVMAADPPAEEQRKKAEALFNDGNFREAYDLYRKLVLDPANSQETLGKDLGQAAASLRRLQRSHELDDLLAEAIRIRPEDWYVYYSAAVQLNLAEHHGVLVAGTFQRGNQRGGGAFVDVRERDRAQALIWLNRARQLVPESTESHMKVDLYRQFADVLMNDEAWKLQSLTDLETVPDYPQPDQSGRFFGRGGWGRVQQQGAPVDEEGNPIFYSVPDSFETAKNDGERWRWCQSQMVKIDPTSRFDVEMNFARFLLGQFGVQTLQFSGIQLRGESEEGQATDGVWSLSSLSDDETIARLATGVKRFTLPEEFNYIRIFRKLADENNTTVAPFLALADIYTNRQQYTKAAEVLQESLRRFPGDAIHRERQLNQIIGNWGVFEPRVGSATSEETDLNYRFRNGSSVIFRAQRVKVLEFLNDLQAYIASRPAQLEWDRIQIDQIGHQIIQKGETKYLGEEVANWTVPLDPRPNHLDRRITVKPPVKEAGAYLITAKMEDGNESRIILWLNDTAIVKKTLNNQALYFVADAVTGEPVAAAQIDFFGWRQEFQQASRRHIISTQRFAERTSADGVITVGGRQMTPNFQWMAVIKPTAQQAGQKRLAWLGFNNVWFERAQHPIYSESKYYVITDRPVYRPDQKVQFKIWLRQVKYGEVDNQLFANKSFDVVFNDPQGNEVFKQSLQTDEYGGLQGEYTLPKQAPLGSYSVSIANAPGVSGHGTFRVEEYKKPEFEVTIDSPKEPVSLGETINATIQAKYYYGAPVTQGTVKYKVERTPNPGVWFPFDRWDWLYGNGYWWFTPESNWYPGFRAWGCFPPFPPRQFHPPELVLEQEVPVGEDGMVKVEIDTSLAQALHGDQDHEYTITAEVVDASRRTIVGSGKVLVSRKPYKVYVWTHHGYYQTGATIEASIQARSLDGKGVQGSGTLELLKITYTDGKPVETVVQSWELKTDDEGTVRQSLKASEAGQYRLSFKMKTADDAPVIEGGHLFVVRGEGFDGSEFRFNDLEIIADQKNYAPGDKVELLINTNRTDSTILLFIRPENGIARTPPQVIRLQGKSTTVELDVAAEDMPNFFVEAVTVSNGKVHDVVRELVVPPQDRILNVEVIPNEERYQPGQSAEVEVKVTNEAGEPFKGSLVLSVYDRAVEYISGGSNVPEIREFFWKWKRHHHPETNNNLNPFSHPLYKTKEITMQNLGVFGDQVADMDGSVTSQSNVAGNPRLRMQRGLSGGMGGMGGSMPMPAAAPMMMEKSDSGRSGFAMEAAADAADLFGTDVAPQIRSEFADTAFWKADLSTDANGLAKVTFDLPENLSSWKMRAWGMGSDTRVGEGTAEVVTAKNIIVRLQAPRFFVERDEVVLSAVVHNYLETEKEVTVQLDLEGGTLELLTVAAASIDVPHYTLEPSTKVTIAAGGEARVDWLVRAVQPGNATVTMKALTNEESDAMQMTFPVNVRGILKTESFSGVIRPEGTNGIVEFTIPEDRIPGQTRLEVRYSPTLAGAMVDALPYLASYPYGCTEQTLNRFVPSVITQQVLLYMNVKLKEIQEKRTNLNAQQLGDPAERAKQWKRFDSNPVFDEDELASMVKTGVRDLTSMQNSDGGWGWFSGFGERSYPHTTAVVVHGLYMADIAGVAIPDGVLRNGVAWLERSQDEEVALLVEGERRKAENDTKSEKKYKHQASNLDALVFNVLVESGVHNAEMQRFLYRDRVELSLYSQALLGLALHTLKATEQRDMVIRNIDQFVKVDDENQTAFIDLPNDGWWHWYGSRVEANSFYLRLLTRVNPKDPKAAGLAKYLINNRRHGTYWNNTRDTAYAIEALAEYAVSSGETRPNMEVEIWLDGELKQTVRITPDVLFTFNNTFVIEGEALSAGKHTLELKRTPFIPLPSPVTRNPLYYNAYVTNFTKEDHITATGLEVKVGRKFYKLTEDKEATATVPGSRGQAIDQKVVKYTRTELESLAQVTSGDLIEIELEIDSKNDYEYVIFEDFKAAGTEPVDLQSGYTRGGLGAYVEFRDEKVAFFLRQLRRGKHSVSYRVRAEIPGTFSALPTIAAGMYAPELKANSDDMRLRIRDR